MERLCYGTYVKALSLCYFGKPNQERIHTDLMKPIDGLSRVEDVPAQASRLFSCLIDQNQLVVNAVKSAAHSVIRDNIAEFVKNHVSQHKLETAVAAVRMIIKQDEKIPSHGIVDCISGFSKGDLENPLIINAVDFLAGTFICAVVNANNKEGQLSVKFIDSAFAELSARQFKESGSVVTFDGAVNNSPALPLKKNTERNNGEAAEAVLSASKLKFREYVNLKGIKIEDGLLPEIISDNPADKACPSLFNLIVYEKTAEPLRLLCGEGGSGKTYLLFDCYQALLDDGEAIPFYVPMPLLAKSDESPILHYIFDHYLVKTGWERETNRLRQSLAAFFDAEPLRLVLLLDAYNEYAYAAAASAVLVIEDEIRWLTGFSNVRIIMASRSARGFEHAGIYRAAKLDRQRVAEYLAAHKPTADINIWDPPHEKVMELLRLPIMLTMFTKTYSAGKPAGGKEAEIRRINKHSDILEMCVDKQLGDLRNHQTASYVLKALLPLLSNEMDSLRMKRREVGERAYSAVRRTMSDGYADLWWDYDFDKQNIETLCADIITTYRNLIDGLLLRNGLFLSENSGVVSWQHELLLNWFTAKCIVLKLAYERESALRQIRGIAHAMDESPSKADALLPVALYLYEMLTDDGIEGATEEFAMLLVEITRLYSDWRDNPNSYKFARITFDKIDALAAGVPAIPRWRIAQMKCPTASALLSVDSAKMESGFCFDDCINIAKRHLEESLAWSRLDISTSEDLHAADIVEAMIYGNLGAYYLAKYKIEPDESYLKEALKYHHEGLTIRKSAFMGDTGSPKASAYIGASYHCIATDYQMLGDYVKSLDYYRMAIECRENSGAKEIRLVESYVRAVGVLLRLIKANIIPENNTVNSTCRDYLAEVITLFQKTLQRSGCFRRNRHELSNLARCCEALTVIIDMRGIEFDGGIKTAAKEIAAQIDSLGG